MRYGWTLARSGASLLLLGDVQFLVTGYPVGQLGRQTFGLQCCHDRRIERWIQAQPDLSLAELQQRCLDQLDVSIGITALWHRLRRLGLSFKKNDARRRAGPARR